VRTGQLGKPPGVLNASISKIQAQHLLSSSQIPRYLAEMMLQYPDTRAQYSFPGREHDQLFLPSYQHQLGPTCDQCDINQTVSRDTRLEKDPEVHYGTIGLVNHVVKDSAVRDALKRDMNIICVDMEATGLMLNFPCLIIRGICDYADSHKNKRWQPYASAVAAAYMKELLMVVPVQETLHTTRARVLIVKGESFVLLLQTVFKQPPTKIPSIYLYTTFSGP